jgi:uncharacterized protein
MISELLLRPHGDRVALGGNSLGGAHVISVAADDPRIAAVVTQIPFNGFPRRVEGRSTGAALRLFGAMVWTPSRDDSTWSPTSRWSASQGSSR